MKTKFEALSVKRDEYDLQRRELQQEIQEEIEGVEVHLSDICGLNINLSTDHFSVRQELFENRFRKIEQKGCENVPDSEEEMMKMMITLREEKERLQRGMKYVQDVFFVVVEEEGVCDEQQ